MAPAPHTAGPSGPTGVLRRVAAWRLRAATGAAAVLVCVGAGPAAAHDSWFTILPPGPGPARLVLATGNAYPDYGFLVLPEHLADARCTAGNGQGTQALQQHAAPDDADALQAQLMHLGWREPTAHCWSRLKAADITIDDEHVSVYLDEAQAAPALRQRWAAQQRRGQPWQERYAKLARAWMDLSAPPPPRLPEAGLDLRPTPRAADGRLVLRVERHGQPVARQPVQWVSMDGQQAVWTTSDAQGLVRYAPPQPGAWLARAIHLQPPARSGGRWQGNFATVAFTVPATAPR